VKGSCSKIIIIISSSTSKVAMAMVVVVVVVVARRDSPPLSTPSFRATLPPPKRPLTPASACSAALSALPPNS